MKLKMILAVAAAAVGLLPSAVLAQSAGGQFSGEGGKNVFEHVCQACHLTGGVGYPGAYPALAKNPKLAAAAYPVTVVVNGMNAMPPLGRMLSDQQVSDVVNYVRSNLGNTYKPTTTPADVAAARR